MLLLLATEQLSRICALLDEFENTPSKRSPERDSEIDVRKLVQSLSSR